MEQMGFSPANCQSDDALQSIFTPLGFHGFHPLQLFLVLSVAVLERLHLGPTLFFVWDSKGKQIMH